MQTVLYAAQAIPQICHAQGVIDAEIAGKGHLWTETSYWPELARYRRSQTERTAPMITRHEPLFNLWRSLKDNVIFWLPMNPVRQRRKKMEYPDIPVILRLASQAPQRPKLRTYFFVNP